MARFTKKQIAAQRKFAAAARYHGGRIPKGAKTGARRAVAKRATKKRAAAAKPRKPRAPKKKLLHFESKGRKWSQARKDAGGAARLDAAGNRIGGGVWMKKSLRERDVGEYGPRLANSSMVYDPKSDSVAQLGVRDVGTATPYNDAILAKYAK